MHPRCCRPVGRPATSWVHYTTSCNTQSSAPEDGQNNCPKHVELTGIINKPLLLHLVGCLYYLYQWCTVKQISDNEIYLLIKYIKSVLWKSAKLLSYIEDARCLNVNHTRWILSGFYYYLLMFYKKGSKLYFSNFRLLTSFQSDDTRCCINTIWPPDDEHNVARNM